MATMLNIHSIHKGFSVATLLFIDGYKVTT